MRRFCIVAGLLVATVVTAPVRADEPIPDKEPLPAPLQINDRPPRPEITELPALPIQPAQPAQPELSAPAEQPAPTTAQPSANPCEGEWKKVPPVRNPIPRQGWFQIARD